MFPAARKGDPITHDLTVPSGAIGPPAAGPCPGGKVLIEGLPAAHVGCTVVCTGLTSAGPAHPPPPPSPPLIVVKGSATVLIHGMPAARWVPSMDLGACGVFLGNPALTPSRTVLMGDQVPFDFSGVLSPERAAALFALMAAQADLAFRYPTDGCYARNWLMVQRMQQMGVHPMVVWSFANPDNLHVNTPNHPKGFVEWGYHVAPLVEVREPDGKIGVRVIDPSMFDHPVTVDEWKNAQKKNPASSEPKIAYTRPGEPAPNPDGTKGKEGTGYWTGDDPPMGPDEHAKATMKKYKKREGTDR